MSRRLLIGLAILAVILLAVGGPFYLAVHDNQKAQPLADPTDSAKVAAGRFLDHYVEPDGKVVRRDQGGDTVSEGQAYGMLISVAIGDQARFDAVWNWSKAHLVQPDGLMAWRWSNGAITDQQPSSDADLDAARALAVAATRFGDQHYADEARTLAKAIADNEFMYASDGKPILVAGTWARSAPYVINPSYHSPRTDQELAALTDDTRWTALEEHERALMDELIGTDVKHVQLPSDWGTVPIIGPAVPTGSPGQANQQPIYSYDAARTPVRLAESCSAVDRVQAARLWTILDRSQTSRTSADMKLNGETIDSSKTAIGAVAAAAGAHAAGDTTESNIDLDLADRLDALHRTYYGEAWAALGRIMLTTNFLGNC